MNEHFEKGVKFLSFESLDKLDIVKNVFTTRIGGVSTGHYSSMNLGFTNGDDPEAVYENYKRLSQALEIKQGCIVRSKQTHTTNVRLVTDKDVFNDDVLHDITYNDIDGLITNVPDIALMTFYADCVPLYFVDPVNKAIGLSHSGWRGTVNRMAGKTIEAMAENFGTKPSELYAAIGPSICKKCYEISKEVADEFADEFKEHRDEILSPGKSPDKFMLDLWETNRIIMEDAGMCKDHIEISDICTFDNADWLFSHRASGGKRGNLAAVLMLNR